MLDGRDKHYTTETTFHFRSEAFNLNQGLKENGSHEMDTESNYIAISGQKHGEEF